MLDHQWRLKAPDGSVDLTFGTVDTGIQTVRAPDLGQRSVRTRDLPRVREDGVSMGIDYEEGTTLSFEANVLTADWKSNSDKLNELRRAWGARVFRNHPEAYAELEVCNAGRTRVCYGRPRRIAEADGDLTHDGYTAAVFDFATLDGKFYAAEESVAVVPIAAPGAFGFETPIITRGNVAFQSVPKSINLVTNPSFEVDDTEFWASNNAVLTAVDGTESGHGDRYLRATINETGPTGSATTNDMLVVAGKTYTGSFEAKGSREVSVQIRWKDASGAAMLNDTGPSTQTDEFVRRSWTAVAPPGAATGRLLVFWGAGAVGDTIDFDAARFSEGTETDYFDGDTPGCEWLGAPHASESTRDASIEEPSGNVTVAGSETWAWVEITGPVTNPEVQLGDITLALDYTLADGETVLLDPRPWSRRVIRVSDGANLADRLTWKTPPMGQWRLDPGSYELVFRGDDPTGTSSAIVHWREAFDRP